LPGDPVEGDMPSGELGRGTSDSEHNEEMVESLSGEQLRDCTVPCVPAYRRGGSVWEHSGEGGIRKGTRGAVDGRGREWGERLGGGVAEGKRDCRKKLDTCDD